MDIKVLGVMTGTSCDGLDAVCMSIESLTRWKVLWKTSVAYPSSLRKQVLNFQNPKSRHTLLSLLELHRDLGIWYGSTLHRLIQAQAVRPDLIANHGQTIAHFPGLKKGGTTLQLGDSSQIAVKTGLSVISQFREGDLAAGGVGAPLTPLFHKLLAKMLKIEKKGVAIHNIGGISNLTYLYPSGEVLALDTGPGNIWIDATVEKVTRGKLKFDPSGRISTHQTPDLKAVQRILKHPYFSREVPKSTGRDEFPFSFFEKKYGKPLTESSVATATEVTIQSIVQAYDKYIVQENLPLQAIFLCGGGAKNLAILQGIRKHLPKVQVSSLMECGVDPQFVEAQAFAVLGYLGLLGQALGGPWTGVQGFAPPAHIIPGKNWKKLLRKLNTYARSTH